MYSDNVHTQKELDVRAGNLAGFGKTYDFHLELLEEWNEDASFEPIATTIHVTGLGVMVTQDVQESVKVYEEGAFAGLKQTGMVQLCAVYGDEEQLMRLVIFTNDGDYGQRTQVLVNDGPIRG
jgi:hypothetical protein